jgi:hypothetical protein
MYISKFRKKILSPSSGLAAFPTKLNLWKPLSTVSCYNSYAVIVSCNFVCEFQFKGMAFSNKPQFPVL